MMMTIEIQRKRNFNIHRIQVIRDNEIPNNREKGAKKIQREKQRAYYSGFMAGRKPETNANNSGRRLRIKGKHKSTTILKRGEKRESLSNWALKEEEEEEV